MLRNVRVFSLFLAGAGDVDDEKDVVRHVVEEWNVQHGLVRRAFITLGSWKTSTYPAAGTEPQEIINRQAVDEADIVLGVFWTRFGAKTSRADSGTEEEIESSIGRKKNVMVYFSDRPVPPSTMDSEQYAKVQAFKARYANRGLYSTYKDLAEFRGAVRGHVAHMMNDLLAAKSEAPGSVDDSAKDQIIEIGFSDRYWTVILAALDHLVQVSAREIEHIRRSGKNVESLSGPQTTALVGPLIIRSRIVDTLVQHGIIDKAAADRMGYKALIQSVEAAQSGGKKKTKKRK